MSIVVLNAASSLKCYAPKIRPTKGRLARAVITKLNEYSPVFPPSLRVVKEHLLRLEEVRPAVHAPPQAAVAATCSLFNSRLQRSEFRQHYLPACENQCQKCNGMGWAEPVGIGCVEIEGQTGLQYDGFVCRTRCMNLESRRT